MLWISNWPGEKYHLYLSKEEYEPSVCGATTLDHADTSAIVFGEGEVRGNYKPMTKCKTCLKMEER